MWIHHYYYFPTFSTTDPSQSLLGLNFAKLNHGRDIHFLVFQMVCQGDTKVEKKSDRKIDFIVGLSSGRKTDSLPRVSIQMRTFFGILPSKNSSHGWGSNH